MNIKLTEIQQRAYDLLAERINYRNLLYLPLSGYAEVTYNKIDNRFEVTQARILDYSENRELIVRVYYLRDETRADSFICHFEVNNEIFKSLIFVPYRNIVPKHDRHWPGRFWRPWPGYIDVSATHA